MEKKEYPELEELVICTVKKIIGTSVFLHIKEYDKEGVMMFSEVAPGRIRNIRAYVAPNKKVVCKVLRVDKKIGHIDLSLRRVSSKDQKEKLMHYTREKANKIILKMISDESIVKKVKQEFSSITEFFDKILQDEKIAKKFLNPEQAEKLIKTIKEKEKQKRIKVTLKINLQHFGAEGIEIIKKILQEKKRDAKINYISAPVYTLILEGKDYKETDKNLVEIANNIIQNIKAKGGKGEIIEKKK